METHAYITCPSSKIHAWIHVYANTYAHLAKSLWASPLTMRFTEISTIQNSRNWIAMIVACTNRARFVRTSFRQTVEMEKWRISSTGTARVSIVIEKWARPESGNGRALFALEQWGSIKSRGFVYSRIIHLRVRRTNGRDLWAERIRYRMLFFAV